MKTPTRKSRAWGNFGKELQVYDILFEVSKLDLLKQTTGKDSNNYKSQHQQVCNVLKKYNESRETFAHLNISKCRSIINGLHYQEDISFDSGKKDK